MISIILIDDKKNWKNLLPFTYTKPICYLRFGILTIKEKWEKHLNAKVEISTESYLNDMFPNFSGENAIYVTSIVCPDKSLLNQLQNLNEGEGLFYKDELIALNGSKQNFIEKKCVAKQIEAPPLMIHHVWDLFQKNSFGINFDFELLTNGKTSEKLSESNTVIGDTNLVFLEKGAKAEACIFNTSNGPIYLAKNSEVMEGSVIRGPFSLGESSVLKLSTKIYGATTIGPQCKVGGEVNNSVIFGYTNKAHDGFLGNSVLGEWCNLGADTNNSNLKNNYGNVKLYNYLQGKMIDTGLQFCGLMMGDYSKSGINTMFNTGTVVGVGVNVFGGGFPSSYIPNFSWGGSEGFEVYDLAKLIETNKRVYERRQMEFGEKETKLLQHVLKISLE
ncbi:MAG: putative sugar nucleotidyl transferase [Bacteroidota bacterium]|jgi:UDP-N-acetylglucosamine diphosphorylase/glucosamine-1-phosphate N-acetyltransferase|nr:glucose-1-phosphate thymidylyltransferase [Bacteroidota bacterium]MCA6445206.1 glucose-1-phosphate thymidylyltransferase [Bacteroidota bacterium]